MSSSSPSSATKLANSSRASARVGCSAPCSVPRVTLAAPKHSEAPPSHAPMCSAFASSSEGAVGVASATTRAPRRHRHHRTDTSREAAVCSARTGLGFCFTVAVVVTIVLMLMALTINATLRPHGVLAGRSHALHGRRVTATVLTTSWNINLVPNFALSLTASCTSPQTPTCHPRLFS